MTVIQLTPVNPSVPPNGYAYDDLSNVSTADFAAAAVAAGLGTVLEATGVAATDTTALQALLTAGGAATLSGAFVINAPLVGNASVQLRFEPGSYIDCSALTGSQKAITISGTQSAVRSLSASALINTAVLSCSDTSGLTAGTLLRVCSDDSIDPVRTNSKVGEYARVASASGTTINLLGKLRTSYTTNPRIYVVSPLEGLEIDGLRLQGAEGSGRYLSGLVVVMAAEPRVTGGWVRNCSGASYQFQDCLGGKIDTFETRISATTDTGYGVSVAGCTEGFTVTGHESFGNRHAITTSNSAVAGQEGTTRNIVYEKFAIHGTQTSIAAVGGAAVDTHAAGNGFTARDGEISNPTGPAINIEQANALLENVRIRGGASHAVSLFNFTSIDGDYTLRNINVSGGLRVINGAEGSSSATGKIRTITIDGLAATGFTSTLINFTSSLTPANTAWTIGNLYADMASSVTGTITISKSAAIQHTGSYIGNVPPTFTAWSIVDVPLLSFPVPATIAYATGGSDSSGIAMTIAPSASSFTLYGDVKVTVLATASNTARGVRLGANTRGTLRVSDIQGNAATPYNPLSGAVAIPPRGYPFTTVALPTVPAIAGIEVFDTTATKPKWSDGAGNWVTY